MKKILLYFLLFSSAFVSAQGDTIIAYDVRSQIVTVIAPQPFDSLLTADHTLSSQGSLGNVSSLSLVPPVSNLFAGSDFSDLARAEAFFNVTDYPARTAVRLWNYNADTLGGCCSGILVAKNFVLTAAHCINLGAAWRGDSTLVASAYDNGSFQSGYVSSSKVSKYYVFKMYYEGIMSRDFALLQLDEPIGEETGWVGMAFNSDSAYFSNNVFHKFSYPGMVSPFDPTKIYNGDTLYYNYGYINADDEDFLRVPSTGAKAIPGQSGSSFLYTDNVTDYYTFGTLSYSNSYTHFRIKNTIFYALKNILEQNTTGIYEQPYVARTIKTYPNPFSDFAMLYPGLASAEPYTLALYNAHGQLVRSTKGIVSDAIKIERNELSSGLYFFRLNGSKELLANGKFVIR